MSAGRTYLATHLERLLALPLQPKAALDAWYECAREFESVMLQYPDIEIPHNIRHFLSDADIRSKPNEAKYREMQEQHVREFVNELRSRESAS